MNWIYRTYYFLYSHWVYFYQNRLKNKESSLKSLLIKTNRLRWLDLGSSSAHNDGFYFADLHPVSDLPAEMRDNYFQLDITNELTEEKIAELGKFDLIRMQHVFEHFSMEDGLKVLKNCGQLLNKDGYLLISVPDLKIFISRYERGCLNGNWSFADWAQTRIEPGSPQSFYFSIFTHSVPRQAHLWCYDEQGLKYQINRTGKYKEIKKLSLYNSLANIPFTHNRPEEDLCMIAQKC